MGSANFCVFVVQRDEKSKKNEMIAGISVFVFFLFFQKCPFCDGYLFSKNVFAETLFYSIWGCAPFGAKLSKKGNFGPPKINKRKI